MNLYDRPVFDVLVPGRFVRVHLKFSIPHALSDNLASLKVFNIHDEHLPANLSMSALQVFQDDVNFSRNFPLKQVVVFAGDLNRPESGARRFYHDPIKHAQYDEHISTHSDNMSSIHKAWDNALSNLVELGTRTYSHYSSAEQYENKIDRIFWSIPPWASRHMFLSCPKFPSAFNFHRQGLSDHSPVAFQCSSRSSSNHQHRSILLAKP